MSELTDVDFCSGTEIEQRVIDALGHADVRRQQDGIYVVDAANGGRIMFGEDDGWWTATALDPDGTDHLICEGTDLDELGRVVTHRAGP